MIRPGFVAVLLLAIHASSTPAQDAAALTPRLLEALRAAAPGDFVPVLATFDPWLRLEEHLPVVEAMHPEQRRRHVTALLRNTADSAQRAARTFLDGEVRAGRAGAVVVLWINNSLAFRATPAVILSVAEMRNVRTVDLDPEIRPEEALDLGPPGTPGAGNVLLNAPQCWALGYQGQGIVLANADTGCNYNHPDLVSHVWNNPGEIAGNGLDDDTNGFIDDIVGWNFSASSNNPIETGSSSHGSQCGGILCGDGTQGTATGVAPMALQMVMKLGTAPSGWFSTYQYAVANGARVISSSNSLKWPNTPDYPLFRQTSDMELLAGVLHTNSIGNQGPGSATYPVPFNIAAPGCCPPPWLHPGQTLAGGISSTMGCGAADAATATLMSYSGRGPFAWNLADVLALNPSYPHPWPGAFNDYPVTGGAMGLLKPDVVCPTNTPSTSGTGTGYTSSFTGTSCATPHLGGCAAVILSVNPLLTPSQVCEILQITAIDQGAPGKDNDWGAGRVDLLAAVTLAQTYAGSAGPLADLSFEAQTAGAAPSGEWASGAVGASNVAGPAGGCTSVAGMPFGGKFMIVDAAGSNAATPPSGSAGPAGASTVEQIFGFEVSKPLLRLEMAFENAHGGPTPATNDFASATVTNGSTAVTFLLLDTLTPTAGPGCAGGLVTARVTGSIDLAASFPGIVNGAQLTLILACGNGGNGILPSRAYVDDLRLIEPGFRLRVADHGTGDMTIDLAGAPPLAELFTIWTTALATPTGSGPFLGLSAAALPEVLPRLGLPLGTEPAHVLADAAGRYVLTLPNGSLPPGVSVDAVGVAIAAGAVLVTPTINNTW